MAVYVDNARIPFGRMKMCHLLADSQEELLAMADRIGLNRRHFQCDGRWPHFDVCMAYREKAIAAGAIPVTRRELGALLRRLDQRDMSGLNAVPSKLTGPRKPWSGE